jgi:type I restriction enzyme S subunit
MRWQKKPLAEVAELCLGKMLDQNKNRGLPMPYLANLNVRWGEFDFTNLRQMRFEAHEIERYGLKFGDIIMCEGGEPGRCALWKSSHPGMMIQKALHRIRPHSCMDSQFLYYNFLYMGINNEFDRFFTGSTIKHLPREKLALVDVAVPSLAVQRSIANILSAYDDLIENNQRRIKILEEMAGAIYREWFVNFRFPGHESVPLVPSPLGEIPQGWEVKTVHNFGKVITGKTPSKLNKDYYGKDVPFVKTPDMHENLFILDTNERLSDLGANLQKNKSLPSGAICVSCIGTIGVVAITTEKCQTNQQINSIILDCETSKEFLFFRLCDAKQALENLGANGATMGNVNKAKFEDLTIITPTNELLVEYHNITKSKFAGILNLYRQIQNLRRTRDLLLPRLLSGQINVEAITP